MKRIYFLFLMFCLVLAGCAKTTASLPENVLEVHYIDVGQADCIFLRCEGQTTLIDGGNVEDSDLVVSYLLEQNVTKLDYVSIPMPMRIMLAACPVCWRYLRSGKSGAP